MTGQIFARNCAVHGADCAGKEAVAIHNGGDLVIGDGIDGLAAIERFERGKARSVTLDGIGDAQELG